MGGLHCTSLVHAHAGRTQVTPADPECAAHSGQLSLALGANKN